MPEMGKCYSYYCPYIVCIMCRSRDVWHNQIGSWRCAHIVVYDYIIRIMSTMHEIYRCGGGGGGYLEYLYVGSRPGALSVIISTGVFMLVHSSYMGKATWFLKTLPLHKGTV